MICPYSFDEPVGSGIPALLDGRYWCMGHIALGMSARRRRCPEDCPVDMGEWGAWRGTVMQHVEAFEFYSWLEIPYGGSLQTDFKTHGDVCRSCEYGIDYKGRSFCCKPCYWVGGRTHGVRDCSAYVRSGVGWSP